MEPAIVIALIYLAFHNGHAHAKYRYYSHKRKLVRIWLSIPGPFGTRISKRLR
jgi:hypothetical protein